MREILQLINDNHIFKDLPSNIKARIVPILEVLTFQKGDLIYKEKEKADAIYFIASGAIKLSDAKNKKDRKENTFFGEESFFEVKEFMSNAWVESTSCVVKIPNSALELIKEHNPKLVTDLFSSFSGKDLKVNPKETPLTQKTSLKKNLIGWVFSFIIPIFVYITLNEKSDHSNDVNIFLSVFSGCITFWIFNIFHESIPGIMALAATLVLGLVPPEAALSGFASESFIIGMSLWGFSILLIESGLIQRLLLYLIRYIPQNFEVYNVALFLLGGMLTPIIPSIVNRTSLASPIVSETLDILHLEKESVLSTKISASVFFGFTIFSSIFFTGSIMNFIVFGFLSLQEQQTIEAIGWFYSTSIVGLTLGISYLAISSIFFTTREKISLSKKMMDLQIKTRGPLTSEESMAIYFIIFFIISVFTIEYHHIPIAWISLFILFAILSTNLITPQNWQKKTDWSFLLFLASIIGINSSIKFLEIDQIFRSYSLPFMESNLVDFSITTLTMCIVFIIIILRFILPIGPTIALLFTVLVQISESFGLSIWLLGFIILLTADIWWLPYQSPFYLRFVASFSNGIPYKENAFLLFNALMNIIRIVAIYLSIPYWKNLGFIF